VINESIDSVPDLTHKLQAELKTMFEDETLSDFRIKTNDGKTLKCHKSILASRSKVFLAILTQEMPSNNRVKVHDFDSKIMKEVLRFIYCNEVNELSTNAWELCFAAEKYDLQDLKTICFNRIIETLTSQNVLKALLIAHQLESSESLYIACLKMIKR
jgi:BTB/POZ domain